MRPDHLEDLKRPPGVPWTRAPVRVPDYSDPRDRAALRLYASEVRATARVLQEQAQATCERVAATRQRAQVLLWQDRQDHPEGQGGVVVELGEARRHQR